MPKDESKIGPMKTQPLERTSTTATPVRVPVLGNLLRAAKAKILRRNSLRKQRQAQMDNVTYRKS
jgi:hypothetical protein